jgi:hypothetical protein
VGKKVKAPPAGKPKDPPPPEPAPVAALPPLPPFPMVPDSELQPGRMVRIVETQPEPTHERVEGSARTLPLAVSAVADAPQVELRSGEIAFRPTMMLQTRAHVFTLENTGKIAVPFELAVAVRAACCVGSVVASSLLTVSALQHDGVPDVSADCPFVVSPASGLLPAGGKAEITVRFAPREVDDYERTIVCTLPGVAVRQSLSLLLCVSSQIVGGVAACASGCARVERAAMVPHRTRVQRLHHRWPVRSVYLSLSISLV